MLLLIFQKGKTQSKKKALYGVFEDSSDEEGGRGGLGSRGKKAKADYSAPIGFVSGGLKGQEKKDKDCEYRLWNLNICNNRSLNLESMSGEEQR
jgi:hypothetical protein